MAQGAHLSVSNSFQMSAQSARVRARKSISASRPPESDVTAMQDGLELGGGGARALLCWRAPCKRALAF